MSEDWCSEGLPDVEDVLAALAMYELADNIYLSAKYSDIQNGRRLDHNFSDKRNAAIARVKQQLDTYIDARIAAALSGRKD